MTPSNLLVMSETFPFGLVEGYYHCMEWWVLEMALQVDEISDIDPENCSISLSAHQLKPMIILMHIPVYLYVSRILTFLQQGFLNS